MAGNIALNKYATASNSVFPFTPAKAVNGVESYLARWLGSLNQSNPYNWLSVDLGDLYWVNRWVVKHMGEVGWPDSYNLIDYKLQGSVDGTNWSNLDSVTGNTAKLTDRSFFPTKVRYARLYITSGIRCNPKFASVAGFELYAADPTDSKLSGLVLSNSIALIPEFDPAENTYNANAKYDDSSITVTPTVADPRASIEVNGSLVTNGQPSKPISLNVGVNSVIPINVTPYIGKVNTYTINVVRATSPYLSGLTLQSGRTIIPINPVFEKNILHYSGEINRVNSLTVTANAEDINAKIMIKGQDATSGVAMTIPVNVGLNSIDIIVESKTGVDSKTYVCDIVVT